MTNFRTTTLKALNWRQIASLTNGQLDELLATENVYDDVTYELAEQEDANRDYETRVQAGDMIG